MRYIGRMTWDKVKVLGLTTDFNNIASAAYIDGQISYNMHVLGKNVSVYLNIQNLANKGFVYAPKTTGATPLPTDAGLYDQVGRMYHLGLKTRF
jgi:outer membrane receptor protein involved in Fe transport